MSESCEFGCGPTGPEYVNAGVGVVPACPVHGWFAPFVDSLQARLDEAERRVRELEADPSRPTVVYAGDELEACEEKLAAAEEQLRAVGG